MDNVQDAVRKILEEKIKYSNGDYFRNYIEDAVSKKDILIESAKRFGTPQYILDADKLKQRALFFIDTFRKHIPDSEFFYAFKCNDLPVLVGILKDNGYNADVSGLFELKLALKLGFDKIIFTSPGKDLEELKLAIENNVIINLDNFDELDNLIGLAGNSDKKIKISIRVNPDSYVTKKWSKFGVNLSELKKIILKIESSEKIILSGIHFHCSWNETPERYVKNIELISSYLKNNFSKEELSMLSFLDIGGGFYPEGQAILAKEDYKGSLINMINEYSDKEIVSFDPHNIIIEEVEQLEKFAEEISLCLKKNILDIIPNLKIYFEPGRFITIHSTSILLNVISIKNDEGVIVDGGINLVGDYRFSEYSFAPIVNLSSPSLELKRKIIHGPLCDPSDLFGYSFFGNDVKKGDILAVLNQGAYTFSCAWRFIKATAPYVVMQNKKLFLGKEKEKFEDRYKGCKI